MIQIAVNGISNLFNDVICWLARKRVNYQIKKILELQNTLLFEFIHKVRILTPTARLEGHDESFDKAIILAFNRLSEPEKFSLDRYRFIFKNCDSGTLESYEEAKAQYKKKKIEVDSIIERISTNSKIENIVCNFRLCKCFLHELLFSFCDTHHDKLVSKYYFNKAKQINPNSEPLNLIKINKLKKQSMKETKKMRKEVIKRQTIKIDILLKDLPCILPFIPVLSFLSGFAFNYYILGSFGINSTHFFHFYDYIYSTLEYIGSTLANSLLSMIYVFYGMYHQSKKSILEIKEENKQTNPMSYLIIFLFLIFTANATYRLYILGPETIIQDYFVSILLLGAYVIGNNIDLIFRNPRIFALLSYFLLVHTLTLSRQIEQRSNELFKKEFKLLELYEVQTDKTQVLALITGTKEHFFFMNEKRQIIILRNEDVNLKRIDSKIPDPK
jgi:hypothetical protein